MADDFKKWCGCGFDDDMDDFFYKLQNFMSYPRYNADPVWKPAMDIFEVDGEIIILVEIAGVKIEDINISCENSILKITGIRKNEEVKKVNRIGQLEIEYGKFERMIKLGYKADVDNIKVALVNGILKINLPLKTVSKTIKITTE